MTSKVNETGFTSSTNNLNNDKLKSTYKCFNCGGTDHKLEHCPKTHDKDRIKRNRNLFWKQKRENNGNNKTNQNTTKRTPPTTGKWVPPSKKEKNQRNIDGKVYHWKSDQTKWVLAKDKSSSSDVTNSSNFSFTMPSLPSNSNADKQLAYANFSKQLEETFKNFKDQFDQL